MPEFTIYKFLATVFTPEFSIPSPLKTANYVVELLGDYLGEEPTILPIPKDAPPDIVRIVFSGPKKKWTLNISPSRTNLFFNISPASTENEMSANEFSAIASDFFKAYHRKLDLRVQRLALVTERSIIREDALNFILDRFCNKEQTKKGRPFFKAKRFEVHSLKNYNWAGFNLNSWVRIKFANIKAEEEEVLPAILVANDLNTLPFDEAPEVSFQRENIHTFFGEITQHLDSILKLYFD